MVWRSPATGSSICGSRNSRERARAALARHIEALTADLLSRVVGGEPVKTGKLRSETGSSVVERGELIRGTVRVAAQDAAEAKKAAALEYGATKPAQVAAHTAQLGHVFARAVAPFEVVVAAYTRRPNLAARRFLRGPLDAMRSEIVDGLKQALEEALG